MSSPDEISRGIWTLPSGLSIRYALPVLHEVEFVIGEGFRRIPHGGIENGGLLFGSRQPEGVEITAFRNIECEHAFGPAFVLSDKDVAALRQQIENYKTDPEISDLEVLGWFISHSRSDLRMTEREKEIFADLFPDPWQITLLAKPEKFKPTRFGFAVREPDRSLNLDLTEQSFILPLPARVEREPVPEGEPPRRRRRPRVEEIRSPAADDSFVPWTAEQSGFRTAPAPMDPVAEGQSGAGEPHSDTDAPPGTAGLTETQSFLSGSAPHRIPAPRHGNWGTRSSAGIEKLDGRSGAVRTGLFQPGSGQAGSVQADSFQAVPVQSTSQPGWSQSFGEQSQLKQPASAWLLITLAVCTVLAIVSGIRFYENYLLPPLTLNISPASETAVIVSWPPSQTVNAESAILTIWKNGVRQDHMLTQDEMQAGAYPLRDADQCIVQLWTHHWYLNRYGNVRVIVPPIVQPAPPTNVLRPRGRVLR